MTKEQKILILLVLLVAGVGTTIYVSSGTKEIVETVPPTVTSQAAPSTDTTKVDSPTTASVPTNIPTSAPTSAERAIISDVVYDVPDRGTENIHVTVTLKDNLIKDVRFTFDPPTKRQSSEYLNSFSKALTTAGIKGKKISDVSLSRLGGASLTTTAFMKALHDIDAKSKA